MFPVFLVFNFFKTNFRIIIIALTRLPNKQSTFVEIPKLGGNIVDRRYLKFNYSKNKKKIFSKFYILKHCKKDYKYLNI